jgi:hypothetical protein
MVASSGVGFRIGSPFLSGAELTTVTAVDETIETPTRMFDLAQARYLMTRNQLASGAGRLGPIANISSLHCDGTAVCT